MNEQSRTDRVKTHFADNKQIYIAVGVGIVVGAAVATTVVKRDAVKVVTLRIFSPGDNLIITNLERRGHPGYLVRCLETGEVYSSINRAAKACSVNAGNLCRHLNGHLEHVKGLHFEKIGEAA